MTTNTHPQQQQQSQTPSTPNIIDANKQAISAANTALATSATTARVKSTI